MNIVTGHVLGTEIAASASSQQAESSTGVVYETDKPIIWTGLLMGDTYPIGAAGISSGKIE